MGSLIALLSVSGLYICSVEWRSRRRQRAAEAQRNGSRVMAIKLRLHCGRQLCAWIGHCSGKSLGRHAVILVESAVRQARATSPAGDDLGGDMFRCCAGSQFPARVTLLSVTVEGSAAIGGGLGGVGNPATRWWLTFCLELGSGFGESTCWVGGLVRHHDVLFSAYRMISFHLRQQAAVTRRNPPPYFTRMSFLFRVLCRRYVFPWNSISTSRSSPARDSNSIARRLKAFDSCPPECGGFSFGLCDMGVITSGCLNWEIFIPCPGPLDAAPTSGNVLRLSLSIKKERRRSQQFCF